MQLEDYFDFEKVETKFGPVESIRLKGHRIDIEVIVKDWKAGYLPEQIVANYPTLSLEKVFATLTYYLREKEKVEEYMRQGDAVCDAYYQEHLQQEPPEVVKRLRALKAERAATSVATGSTPKITAP